MADRLGLKKESYWRSLPYQRTRERFSIGMLFENVTRWYNAKERPHASSEKQFDALDTLLPDGSIVWSSEHRRIFTPERSDRESAAMAERRRNDPPKVDPQGIVAIDKLLTFLNEQGVRVALAHPPFNPLFYDRVSGTPYAEGLRRIEELTADLASRHGLRVVGSFNPHEVGCTASMYIDAEHSGPECIGRLLDEFTKDLRQPAVFRAPEKR
jgi:hypothetical protein